MKKKIFPMMNLCKASIILALAIVSLSWVASYTELETKVLLNNSIEIKVPKDFQGMGNEMLKAKYPSQNGPTLVYTNPTGAINIAFNLTKNKASQELLETYKTVFINTFKGTYPTAEWKETGIKEIHNRKVGYLKVITPALDTKIYNQLFFTDVNGQLLICTFNCTVKNLPEWESLAEEIMNSLKVIKGE